MRRAEKGSSGYLDYKKKIEIIRTIAYFAIVAAVFLLGYFQTGTRLNLLTVVAVLGCLPASKALVGVITRLPHPSIERGRAEEIAEKTRHLTVCYDMVITSRNDIMPVDCIVISGHNIFGYTRSKKTDLKTLGNYIRTMLTANGFDGLTVKILGEYKPFLTRAEGLDNIAAVEKEDTKETEEAIKNVILNISL